MRLPKPLRRLCLPVAWLGGACTFAALQVICRAANPRRRTPMPALDRLRPFFPDLPLERVRLRLGAHLPIAKNMSAITLGWTVYLRQSELDLGRFQDIELLAHELVHVRQYAKLGRLRFGARYGAGVLEGGYWEHPMEQEAYGFTAANAAELAAAFATENPTNGFRAPR